MFVCVHACMRACVLACMSNEMLSSFNMCNEELYLNKLMHICIHH